MSCDLGIILKEIIQRYVFYILAVCFILGFGACFIVFYLKKQKEDTNSTVLETISETQNQSTIIDLSGAVKHPGLYEVELDLRVGDVINMGGGLTEDASSLWISKKLNLSKKLTDEQKIYIPFEWELYEDSSGEVKSLFADIKGDDNNSSSDSNNDSTTNNTDSNDNTNDTNDSSDKINVNTASLGELDSLSGVGPTYAQRIIDNRTYTDIADFRATSTIPKSTIDKIEDFIIF